LLGKEFGDNARRVPLVAFSVMGFVCSMQIVSWKGRLHHWQLYLARHKGMFA